MDVLSRVPRRRGSAVLVAAVLAIVAGLVPTAPGVAAAGDAADEVAAIRGEPSPVLQAGRIRLGHHTARITFPHPMNDPIVVLGAPAWRGTDGVAPTLRSVDAFGFEAVLEEWPGHDGPHAREEIAWLAVERGTHDVDGHVVRADVAPAIGATRSRVRYQTTVFPTRPVVLATTMSTASAEPAAVRPRGVNRYSFEVELQSAESRPTPPARPLHWVAIGSEGGPSLTVGELEVSHVWAALPSPADTAPCVLAGMQTRIGADTAVVREHLTGPARRVRVAEDTIGDAETGHARERIGWVRVDCTDDPAAAIGAHGVDHVLALVVDGLRPDAVDAALAAGGPGAAAFAPWRAQFAWTTAARTDGTVTKTLPNHTGMLSGLPAAGAAGHGVLENVDTGLSVHDHAGRYVPSVFDVVHDHGGRTGLFHGKEKLKVVERAWDGPGGARDVRGADDGRDKVDVLLQGPADDLVATFLDEHIGDPFAFALLTLRDPDVAGHADGWGSPAYADAVDDSLGRIAAVLDAIAAAPNGARTVVTLTADHGGLGTAHGDPADPDNFTIPFGILDLRATAPADLYALAGPARTEPGTGQPVDDGTAPPPIRNTEVANLALGALGLPPVPGSAYGVDAWTWAG